LAVILPGPLVSDVRGRVGDVVFERNAGGLYVRAKGTVTQEVTEARTAAKAAFSACSSAWSGSLTSVERAAWEVFASRFPDVDRWGRPKYRTGFQSWVGYAFHIRLAFGDFLQFGPPREGPWSSWPASCAAFASGPEIDTLADFPWRPSDATDMIMVAYQGAVVSAVREYFSSPYRFMGSWVSESSEWPPMIVFTPVFDINVGGRTWVKLVVYSGSDGRFSRPCVTRAEII
jgi:hypothetical protein